MRIGRFVNLSKGCRDTKDKTMASLMGGDWNASGGNAPNNWIPPSNDDTVWSGQQDRELKRFYDNSVNIKGVNFQDVQIKIDHLLKCLYKEMKIDAETSYRFLRLKPFLKQGGSREGLKVVAANEFDALLPFTFDGITCDIIESSPDNSLPPGLAEICIKKVGSKMPIRPVELLVDRNGQKYVSSRVFHDKLFKSLVDTALQRFKEDPDLKSYDVKRQASAPAIKLDVTINGNKVSIDVVPGLEIPTASSLRKFVVTRWIPVSKNVNRSVQISDPNTVWRVSYSYFEMRVLDDWGNAGPPTAKRLMRAARILKGLRVKDKERNGSSQLHHVLTSYHIKNTLLYSLLCLTKVQSVSLSSVTEALAYLVFMLKSALKSSRLPQFFSFNPRLASYFPQCSFHTRGTHVVNLFQERSEGEIQQVRADLTKALKHFNLQQLLDTSDVDAGALRPFLDNISA